MKKILSLLLGLAFTLSGCAVSGEFAPAPTNAATIQLPDKITKGNAGIPSIKVYVVDTEKTETMDIETYVAGVLAGEMKNDWPMEALRAQAILARTFVLKFLLEKQSRYGGADISTDIEEAQAYNAKDVNARILQAVKSTEGMVLSAGGTLPYAWFHAHSGGMTALAREGLGYDNVEPAYTLITKGQDSSKAPEDAKAWSATFTKKEVLAALEKTGISADGLSSLTVARRGDSGRATLLNINSAHEVSAPDFRIALGSTKMRSTLLTSLQVKGDSVLMAGKGYGHGVGMPQWGAYQLAEEGKKAEEIVLTYFEHVTIAKAW